MPEDFYSDAAPPADSAPKDSPTGKSEAGDSQTAELPLAVFPEHPKVGDKCEFEVTQVSEDSAIVKYASRSQEEEPPPEQPAPEPAAAPGGGGGGPMSAMLG